MTKKDKLIQKILKEQLVSFDEAASLLKQLGYLLSVRGSHHKYSKQGMSGIVIPYRKQLLPCYVKQLKELLKAHGY